MTPIEITAIGFDASTDATDDHIIWVAAVCLDAARTALAGVPYREMCNLNIPLVPHEMDFFLPADLDALKDKLNSFAANASAKEMERRVCTLRELVLAHHAMQRAYAEFYESCGSDTMHMETQCDLERRTRDWLEDAAPADGRDVVAAHVVKLLEGL